MDISDRTDAVARVVAGAKGKPHGKEAQALLRLLADGEVPRGAIRGTYGAGIGLLVFTDHRVIFLDAAFVGERAQVFTLERVDAVKFKTGVLYGEIEVQAAGLRVRIGKTDKSRTPYFCELLQQKIASAAAMATTTLTTPPDSATRIEELVALRKRGVLTEEEFKTKTRDLLEK